MLQIEPFASLVNTVRSTVPRLLLNRHAVGPFERVPLRRGDHMELGDLVATVRRFAEMLGWDSEIEELMSTQETQVGSFFSPFFVEMWRRNRVSQCSLENLWSLLMLSVQ